jgi:hypothetical protein
MAEDKHGSCETWEPEDGDWQLATGNWQLAIGVLGLGAFGGAVSRKGGLYVLHISTKVKPRVDLDSCTSSSVSFAENLYFWRGAGMWIWILGG